MKQIKELGNFPNTINSLRDKLGILGNTLVPYPLDFTSLVSAGNANAIYLNNDPVTKRGLLSQLRIKTVAGSTVTPYAYSITGTNGALVHTLLHTYQSFVVGTIESINVIDDDFIIEAGYYVGCKTSAGALYGSIDGKQAIEAGNVSWAGISIAFDFVLNTNVIVNANSRLTILETAILSPFKDKKLVVEGDSIMIQGLVTSEIATRTGCIIDNQAVSGTGYATGATTIRSRVVDILSKAPKGLLFVGGCNDFGDNIPLGSSAVINDDTQFYSAVYNTFRVYREQNRLTPALVATPIQRFYTPLSETRSTTNSLGLKLIDYVNVIKAVAQIFSLPVIDLYSISGITWENITDTTSDGVHVNATGAKMMAIPIVNAMKESSVF